ncbi:MULTISPECIES: VOC family protein [Bacillus]|uniref:VOC family protein n=1 Tax=Bacillus TaxID=1386 RepID=UPI0006AA4A56|nr:MULTISPECIES: VOC family protein [Bacillus]MBY7130876.1 VOC family protein [Bacillus sp. 8YEL33]OKO51024.1 glyoxalase [Bacillus toyonensis]PEK30828.1 VOC family protein [Bacillus toyonensis]PEL72672.1 VOC family protein [Bacillus toyonensis]PFX82890.1 VOC family protein [Bacillus toyonensis]
MKLNHLNLCVDDLLEARHFFETFFDFQFLEQKGKALVVMSDESGFILVLSDPKSFKGNKDVTYPEAFHIGFLVETTNEVDKSYNRLVAGGIEIDKAPYVMRGSSYGFYFTMFNGLLIEVSYLDYKDGKKVR